MLNFIKFFFQHIDNKCSSVITSLTENKDENAHRLALGAIRGVLLESEIKREKEKEEEKERERKKEKDIDRKRGRQRDR